MVWVSTRRAPARQTRRREPGTHGTTEIVKALVGNGDWAAARACERTVHYWRMSGAVTPSVRAAAGSGTAVRWSDDDLDRLERIWALRDQMRAYDMKLSLKVVREMWAEGRMLVLQVADQAELNR